MEYQLTKQEYFFVRDKAWEFLIKNKIDTLPIDLEHICKINKWNLFSYSNPVIERIDKTNLRDTEIGFTIPVNNEYFIFYSDKINEQLKRYTIAHEIGHIILEDLDGRNEINNFKAELFAIRILAPMGVLRELNVSSAEQIQELCNISIQASNSRFKRLQMLKAENRYTTTHELEKQIIKNFLPFIKKNKK